MGRIVKAILYRIISLAVMFAIFGELALVLLAEAIKTVLYYIFDTYWSRYE
jgi:uncharacterized membrane protein